MKRAGKLGGPAEEIGGILEGNEAFQFWLFRQKWKEIVGDVLAEESYIGRQEGDTIYICCTNSVWMQELMMNRAEILRRIQEDPFGKRFRNIRIQQGPRQRREAGKTTADGLEKYYGRDSRLRNAPISEKDEAWIRSWTEANVEKAELRPLIADMMRNALRLQRAERAEGWHSCERCGSLCPKEDRLCGRCRIEEESLVRSRLILLLQRRPELLYEDARRAVPCTWGQFSAARDMLMSRYRENYAAGCGTEEEKRRLLSLLIHKPFYEITAEEAEKTLSALPRRKYVRKDGMRRK